jgi:ComF family protein
MLKRAAQQFKWLGALILPSRCVLCLAQASTSQLCHACAVELPPNTHCCQRCGESLHSASAACGPCLKQRPLLSRTLAPYQYGAPIDALILRFKRGGDLAAGRVLAQLLADAASQLPASDQPSALIPVPMHIARLRARGFDQTRLLGTDLSRACKIPLLDALVRTRDTPSQGGLKRLQRRRNMHRAFASKGAALPAHVALIDDVATTGSTLNACALVLRRAGVARVDAWVIAKA